MRRIIVVNEKPRIKRRGKASPRRFFGAFEEITDQYLEDTINDCRRLKSTQHAINKKNLVKICQELLKRRHDKN